MGLPIDLDVAECVCDLCGHGSLEESPFEDAELDDVYGGRWPWHRYKKSKCAGFKAARDKLCLMCFIAFNKSSLRLKFDSVKAYLNHVRGQPEEHATFRKAVIKLVQILQEDPHGYVIALKRMNVKQAVERVFEDSFEYGCDFYCFDAIKITTI